MTQPAPGSIRPADVITLYKQCVTSGLLASFTVRNCAGYEEANFCCCFPSQYLHLECTHLTFLTPLTPVESPHSHHQLSWPEDGTPQRPDEYRLLPPPQLLAPPPHPNVPSSQIQTPSPMAPPPSKKAMKRQCELELLRVDELDINLSLLLSPSVALTT
jgi:hypothetical protein